MFRREVLFSTINAEGVIADTVFQAIMSVEKDLWNVSKPDLDAAPPEPATGPRPDGYLGFRADRTLPLP